jgi:methyltransferase
VNVPAPIAVPLVALLAVMVMMLAELWLSMSNERVLRSHGAIEAGDPVFALMRLAYPGVFIAMAVEGAIAGAQPGPMTFAGVSLMFAAKALKFWAIASLGTRWTYKVLVLPGRPLVATGPYRWFRHPNYIGVIGELLAMALMTRARITGPLGTVLFGWVLFRRIAAEQHAIELYSRSGRV